MYGVHIPYHMHIYTLTYIRCCKHVKCHIVNPQYGRYFLPAGLPQTLLTVINITYSGLRTHISLPQRRYINVDDAAH